MVGDHKDKHHELSVALARGYGLESGMNTHLFLKYWAVRELIACVGRRET